MTKYQVFDNGKTADYDGALAKHKAVRTSLGYWSVSVFDSKEEAVLYAVLYLGAYAPIEVTTNLSSKSELFIQSFSRLEKLFDEGYEYSGYGDTLIIKEVS